jgi:hypothetical protein
MPEWPIRQQNPRATLRQQNLRCLHAEAINNYDAVAERELSADGQRKLAGLGWEKASGGKCGTTTSGGPRG